MIWVIQENLWNEPEYRKFLSIMDRSEIPYKSVTVVPFSHELKPEIKYDGRKIAYGSTTLMKITMKENWDPGCYYNKNYDSRVWSKEYKEDLLSNDAVFCKFKDVNPDMKDFFIRPCEDLKQFTGAVVKLEEFKEWQERVLNLDSESTLTKDSFVMVASPKVIYKEYRFFIVDNKICTCSTYKLGGELNTKLPVEKEVHDFVERMIKKWTPNDVFVLDVALTPDGYKVIEINCANSAGFYNCDVSKIVQSIWDYEFRKIIIK